MDESRVQQIEEAQAFADKRTDALDEAIRELGGRVLQLLDRFESPEGRFEQLSAAQDVDDHEDEIPPHSGRLPGGR